MNPQTSLLKGALRRLVDSAIELDEARPDELDAAKETFQRNVQIAMSILKAMEEE